MSISIGLSTNNPGNLTVTGPKSYIYPGQTGVYRSPNGLFYPVFNSLSDGWNALTGWLQNNLGTDSNTSLANNNELVSYYLNGSYNGISATPHNPYPQTYLGILDNSTGLGSNQGYTSITPSLLQNLETGIAQAEGNRAFGAAPLPGSSPQTNGNSFVSGVSGMLQSGEQYAANASDYVAGLATGLLGGNTTPTAQQGPNNIGAQTGADTGSGISSSIGQAVNSAVTSITKNVHDFITGFEGGIQGTLERGGVGVLGLILLAAGIFYIAASSKTVQRTARAFA